MDRTRRRGFSVRRGDAVATPDATGAVDAAGTRSRAVTGGKLDQFGAEIPQFVHRLLLPGLGRALVAVGEIFVVHGKGGWHGESA